MLHIKFKIARNSVAVSTVPYFFSRKQVNVTEESQLRNQNDIEPSQKITTCSTIFANKQQCFLIEKKQWYRLKKTFPWKDSTLLEIAAEHVADEEQFSPKTSIKELTKINVRKRHVNGFKAAAQKQVEENVDLFFKLWNWKW